jgi:AAA domain
MALRGVLGPLDRLRRKRPFRERRPETVVIMDEAGMADSDRLSRLVKVTAEREGKLLLAGDAAQLSSIGPGGLFRVRRPSRPPSRRWHCRRGMRSGQGGLRNARQSETSARR